MQKSKGPRHHHQSRHSKTLSTLSLTSNLSSLSLTSTPTSTQKQPNPQKANCLHLVARFDDLLIPTAKTDEEVEAYFSLHQRAENNNAGGGYISERTLLYPVTQTGDSASSSALFWDILQSEEECRGLYLVVHLYRNGNRFAVYGDAPRRQSTSAAFGGVLRRPFGVAVLGPLANLS